MRARLTSPSLVVTLPSMGHPAPAGTDLHVEQQGRRLAAALPEVADLVLVGHSASCPVVVAVAARVPGVVGLVLIGPVTDPQARSWPRMVARLLRTAAHEPPWQIPLVVPQYRPTGPGSMVRGMNRVRRYRTRVALSALTVPTHVIRGEHDHIASASWCARLTSTAPTEQVTVPGSRAHGQPDAPVRHRFIHRPTRPWRRPTSRPSGAARPVILACPLVGHGIG